MAAIFDAFPSEYAGTFEARERKLSRDKEQLRALGVPLEHVRGTEEDDAGGYRIDRAGFYLTDVALTPEERAALFATGAAALQSAFPLGADLAHALTKLRATHGDGEERAEPIVYAAGTARRGFEDLIVRAVSERRQLKLKYPPESRTRVVDPYVFSARRARYTFVGWCHLRKAIRTFHADRVESCVLAHPKASGPEFEPPADLDPAPHLPVHSWQIRAHAPVEVTIGFPPALEESGPVALGIKPGSPVPATNLDGLISELLALGPGVRIIRPEKAAARMRARLRALRAALRKAA
jgi:proteasome accessory factor B